MEATTAGRLAVYIAKHDFREGSSTEFRRPLTLWPIAHLRHRDVCKRHTDKCATNSASRLQDESRVTPVSNDDGATFSTAGITVAAGTLEQFSPLHEPAAPIFELPVLCQQEIVEEFSPGMNNATIEAHVAAYFEYFHPSLPVLHRASFDVASTPRILALPQITTGQHPSRRPMIYGTADWRSSNVLHIVSNGSQHYSTQLHERWQSYVHEESLKLSIYTLKLLDHHVLSCCNMRSLLSPIELGWELPLAASLWEAGDAAYWSRHFACLAISSMCSLSLATQSLMSETPNPELIVALSASPIALTCILTNLDALVRDFTRCYYQLPPSPPDPSAFHILTQSQNRRVITAMRTVSETIEQKLVKVLTESDQSVWRTCQVLAWSVKLGLCRPDDLLVGGIVESRVFAALLTATHLTIGSYVAFKRMTRALKHPLPGQDCGDDSIIAVIDEVTAVLSTISGLPLSLAAREAPWTTAASYRILLIVWCYVQTSHAGIKLVDIQFDPRDDVAVRLQPDAQVKRARLWTVDPATLTVSLDESEAIFMDLVVRICKDRSVWSIGPSSASRHDHYKSIPSMRTWLSNHCNLDNGNIMPWLIAMTSRVTY
ncbi:zinc finger protein ADR1 [Seiridium cupressi]